MEYFNFLDRIAQAVLNSGSESVNIMLNGVFLKTNGNRIFVTCLKDSNDRRYLHGQDIYWTRLLNNHCSV